MLTASPAPDLVAQLASARDWPDRRHTLHDPLTAVLKLLLPVIEATGVANATDLDLDSLEARLRTESLSHNADVAAPPLMTAWTTVG